MSSAKTLEAAPRVMTFVERSCLVALCVVSGALLAISITGDISVIGPRPLYRQFFLPLVVAAALAAAISGRWPSANATGFGLLVTAPAYLWFTGLYLRYGEDAGLERLAGIALGLCLSGSGALIGWMTMKVSAAVRRSRGET